MSWHGVEYRNQWLCAQLLHAHAVREAKAAQPMLLYLQH